MHALHSKWFDCHIFDPIATQIQCTYGDRLVGFRLLPIRWSSLFPVRHYPALALPCQSCHFPCKHSNDCADINYQWEYWISSQRDTTQLFCQNIRLRLSHMNDGKHVPYVASLYELIVWRRYGKESPIPEWLFTLLGHRICLRTLSAENINHSIIVRKCFVLLFFLREWKKWTPHGSINNRCGVHFCCVLEDNSHMTDLLTYLGRNAICNYMRKYNFYIDQFFLRTILIWFTLDSSDPV